MKVKSSMILATVVVFGLSNAVNTYGQELERQLDRYFETTPRPLTEMEKQQFAQAELRIDELRRQLLEPSAGLTEERIEKIAAEIEPLAAVVSRLEAKQNRWNQYQADMAGAGGDSDSGAISQGVDEAFAATVDVNEFYRLQQDFLALRVAQGRSQAQGMEPRQWFRLANRYWTFSHKRFTLEQSEQAAYLLRARYMTALCRLKGTALRYDASGENIYNVYRSAIEELQAVDRVLKSAKRLLGQPERIEKLPRAPQPYAGLEMIGVESWFEYDLKTDPSRLQGGGVATQLATSDAVSRLLDAACPWGVETFTLLADAGMLGNLDWSILGPFSWKKQEKLAVCSLGPSAVPQFIRAEMEAVRAGVFDYQGRTVNVDWAVIPDEASYSLWVCSPRVFDISPAALFTLAATAVTVSQAGLLDIGVTFLGAGLNVALSESYGADCPVAVAVGVAPDAMIHDVKLTDLKLKRTGLSGMKLAKGIGIQALAVLEEQELRDLFEGYNPSSDSAMRHVGKPLTYAGNPVPPILLRAFIVGIENVPDDEYRRIWTVTKYWQFDPRGLAAIDGRYDLTRLIKSSDTTAAAYLKGDDATQRALWKPLPDSPAKPLGTRVAITDLTPPLQRMTIELPSEMWDSWSKDLPEDRAIVAVVDSRYSKRPDEYVAEFRDGQATLGFRDPDRNPVESFGWMEAKMLTEYPVRILEVGKKRAGPSFGLVSYDLDPTLAVEKGRCVVRFRGTRKLPPSGAVKKIEGGSVAIFALHHIFEGKSLDSSVAPILEFEGDLLPKKLVIRPDIGSYLEGNRISVKYYDDHVNLAGAAGPASVGWHRFKIVLDDKNTFHAHGLVESLGGAAAFAAKIPVSPGLHTIVVSTDGFEPASVLVEREPSRRERVDVEKRMKTIRQYQAERDREPAGSQAYWDEHLNMVNCRLNLARELAEVEQFAHAHAILQEVAREIPQQPIPNSYLESRRASAHRVLMFTLPDVCYRLADVKTMAGAGKWAVEQKIGDRIKKLQSGSDPKRWLLSEAAELAQLIERCILLDADSVMGSGYIASLDAMHQDLLRKAGVYDSQYDGKYIFRYGQEVGQ